MLRDHGFDAVSVQEAGRRGAADSEHLDWAAREGRVLVSHNLGDYARLAQERSHAGILLVRQASVADDETIEAILLELVELMEDLETPTRTLRAG